MLLIFYRSAIIIGVFNFDLFLKVSVFMSVIRSINHLFNSYLSWIVLLMAILAYMLPTVFSWMTPYIAYMLQFVMFAMGLTLTAQVFIDVFKQPMKVILVSVIQFLWMPLAGFLVALAFNWFYLVGCMSWWYCF